MCKSHEAPTAAHSYSLTCSYRCARDYILKVKLGRDADFQITASLFAIFQKAPMALHCIKRHIHIMFSSCPWP